MVGRSPDRDLAKRRLVAQGLVTRPYERPAEAVAASGAMQGQDLPGALASAVLRTHGSGIDDAIDDLNAGRLIRGYPMRGTVFLMAAADLRWVSELCNAPALAAAVRRRTQLGLTDGMVDTARECTVGLLTGARQGLSRSELSAAWAERGVPVDGGRGYHVLAHFIGEGLVCFGPWNGRDQNVVSAATWLPANTSLEDRFNGDRVAATAELLRRYLTSHGPATLRDFAWWTKLPLRQIRQAWSLIAQEWDVDASHEPMAWRPGLDAEVAAAGRAASRPMLLPGFDEFVLGYPDRLFAMTPAVHEGLVPGNNGVFRRAAVWGGVVRGFWKTGGTKKNPRLELEVAGEVSATQRRHLETAFQSFPQLS